VDSSSLVAASCCPWRSDSQSNLVARVLVIEKLPSDKPDFFQARVQVEKLWKGDK
jgi:hypothetical protein